MMFSSNKPVLAAFSLTIAAGLGLFWYESFQAEKVELSEFPQPNKQSSSIQTKQDEVSQSFETLSTAINQQPSASNFGSTEKSPVQKKDMQTIVVPDEIVQLNQDITELISEYDVDNLTTLDCEIIAEQVASLHSTSSIARSRGFGICLDCPDYQHMKDKSLRELKKLSTLGDFDALHLYAEKLALNPKRRLDAVVPYFEAAIQGSVTALQKLQTLYLSQRKTIAEDDQDALQFNALMLYSFAELEQFRQSQPSIVHSLPDNAKDLLEWSAGFYKTRIVEERKKQKLPPLQNYLIEDIPPKIKTECKKLTNDAQPI